METCDRPQLPKLTPESIRISLRQGEWITSIDLSDTYLHLPIHPHSRKFLRFHHKGGSYQSRSLPFQLVTAPLVFTSLVKEVKLLALKQGIRLHQYLDDWLIRAPSQEDLKRHMAKLLTLVQTLGFIVNLQSDPQTTDGTKFRIPSTGSPRNLSSVQGLLCPPLDY